MFTRRRLDFGKRTKSYKCLHWWSGKFQIQIFLGYLLWMTPWKVILFKFSLHFYKIKDLFQSRSGLDIPNKFPINPKFRGLLPDQASPFKTKRSKKKVLWKIEKLKLILSKVHVFIRNLFITREYIQIYFSPAAQYHIFLDTYNEGLKDGLHKSFP